MRKHRALFVCLLAGIAVAGAAEKKVYPKRWVYVSRSLRADRDVDDIRQIVQTGAEHGLNGMLFAGGFDRMDLQPPEYFERLKKIKETCDRLGVEIVPTGFNVGYGGALMSHDRHLAAGLPVYDADDLRNPEGWLEALDQTPGAVGIMYTTWQNKYKLLGSFGDLVSRRK